MGQTREQKIIKQVVGVPTNQKFTPVASSGSEGMFLPNHSGITSHPEMKKIISNMTETDPVAMAYLNQSVKTSSSPSFVKATLTQATGTKPLTITSTTMNNNLNADLLDGYHSTSFSLSTHTHSYKPLYYLSVGETTNATPLDIALSYGMPAGDNAFTVEVNVLGRQNANYALSVAYILRATYSKVGVTYTLIGSVQQDYVAEGTAACDATLVIASNQVWVRVTGTAGTTFDWAIVYSVNQGADYA